MKKILFCGLALLASTACAGAADPLGEWVVEDGVARIRIVDCNTRLWGVISWEKTPGGVDAENPDKSKRTRPTLGIPILLNMKKAPPKNGAETDLWEGKVYNAENGKLYDSKIRLLSPDQLELKGCVLGFLCGGQTWTRYVDPAAPAPAPASAASTIPKVPAPPAKGKAATPAAGVKGTPSGAAATPPATDPATDVCLLPEIAGAPH
jgi:uncharacterized protein (DUF2147 family)